jgi:hypothetical protein
MTEGHSKNQEPWDWVSSPGEEYCWDLMAMGGCRMGIRAEGAPADADEEAFCSGPGGLPRGALTRIRRCFDADLVEPWRR